MGYKLAVVIPTLNEEKFIACCLVSVIGQTFPVTDMDVMVIDGGSDDRTCEVVAAYHKKYSNIRLLNNPRRIQSIAFNIGVEKSDAPYIMRLDAHATYDKYYVERCLKVFMEDEEVGNGSGMIGNVGGVCHIHPRHSGIMAGASAILNKTRFGIGGAAFRVGGGAGYVDTVPFGCFPRVVLNKVGGMREDLPRGEDNEFNSRIRKAGYKVYFDPDIISNYYSRDTLSANIRQMYANGVSIGHLFHVDRTAISLRHFVPFLFVTCIITGIVLSMFFRPFLFVLLMGGGIYFTSDVIASLLAAWRHGWRYFLPLFIMYFCVHVSYGWGTIVGLFTGKGLKK